ncbi:MAG: YciI family protein [Alphaproteobacteria bacterium]|nr:MAG: YciI family protein [Alphaproteobacteria bacterium]
MHFAIVCLDKPDHAAVRADNRPAHLEYLEAHRAQILAAGPLLSDDGESPVGSLLLMEFDDVEAARKFATEDPYNKAGLFRTVTVCPWRKVFP